MQLSTPKIEQPDLTGEAGQTMAEYSVVLAVIVLVIGIGAFGVLALAIIGQYERVTSYLT
jgi:Flp pilus assembly pilin Flp